MSVSARVGAARRTCAPALAAVIVASILAGCGSDATSASSGAKDGRTTRTATKRASPTGRGAVAIRDFKYVPARLTVPAGTTVTWTDDDAANHTVTSDRGRFDLGNIDHGESKSKRFTTPGTYSYTCAYHAFMHGTIIVR